MGEKLSRSDVNRYLGYASDTNINALKSFQTNYIENISSVSAKLDGLSFSTWDDPISTITFSRVNDLKNSYYSTISKNIEDTTTSSLGKLIKAIKELKEKCEEYIVWDNKSYTFPELNDDDKNKYDNDKKSEMTENARTAINAYEHNLGTKESNLVSYSDKIREILAHIKDIKFDEYGTNAEDTFDYSVSEDEEITIPEVTYTTPRSDDSTATPHSNGDGSVMYAAPSTETRIRQNHSGRVIKVGWTFVRFGFSYAGERENSMEQLSVIFNDAAVGQRFSFTGAEYYNTGTAWGYSPHDYGTFTYVGKTQVNRFGLSWKDTTYPIFQAENGKYYTIIEKRNDWTDITRFDVQEVHPRNNKKDWKQKAVFEDQYTTHVDSNTSSTDYDRAVSSHQNIIVQSGGKTRRFVYDVGTGKYYETDSNGYYLTSEQKGYTDPRKAK